VRSSQTSGAPTLVRSVTVLGILISIVAVTLQAGAELVDALALGHRVSELDAGRDGSLFDWASVVAVSAVAVAAAARALCVAGERRRFAVLAGILAFLALDDAIGLHERIGDAASTLVGHSRAGDALYLIVYLPIVGVAFGLLVRAMRESARELRSVMAAGMVLLVAAVVTRLLAGAALALGLTFAAWQRAIGVVAMQGAELASWLLLSTGLTAGLCLTLANTNNTPEVAGS
jgi:hypothetical protein